MSERPNVVLGLLLGAAAIFAAFIVAGIAALGGAGALELAATLVGALTACVFYLTELQHMPLSVHVLALLVIASTLAFARAGIIYLRQRRLLRELPLEPLGGRLGALGRAAGLNRLFITPARRPAAFCFGLVRSRVVVTSGLLERLDADEQAAVVWHEARHARVREPLRCLAARLAARTFFWIPALSDLLDRYLLLKELAADRLAAERTSRRALAGALCEVAGEPASATAVGLSEFAAARVDRLLDPAAPLPPLWNRRRVALSTIAIGSLLIVAAFPGRPQLAAASHLDSMLTTMSLHGLPGMAAGLALNAAILAALVLLARRLGRRNRPVARGCGDEP